MPDFEIVYTDRAKFLKALEHIHNGWTPNDYLYRLEVYVVLHKHNKIPMGKLVRVFA